MTELLHKRMTEIVQGVATAYRCTAEITFSDYCPCAHQERYYAVPQE